MKIKVTSVYVDNQDTALRFYTEVLGFAKKTDFSNGPYPVSYTHLDVYKRQNLLSFLDAAKIGMIDPPLRVSECAEGNLL